MKERITEILTIQSRDGHRLTGKLDLPAEASVKKLVVFVNGSGPNTYDNKRDKGDGTVFNFYDLFASELTNRNIGFFRYSTRGCSCGEQPPFYCTVDPEEYRTYYPETCCCDLEDWVLHLKSDSRMEGAAILLLGWSEGTMIAPMTALRRNIPLDGLLLAGYTNRTMDEVLDWQQRGNTDFIFYRYYFDQNGDGVITREEFETEQKGVRQALGVSFEELDSNGDGILTLEDFALKNEQSRRDIFHAIDTCDDDWLREHYPVLLTSRWFHEHRKLPPNRETMPKLDLPIHIFQGEMDYNTPVEDTYEIRDTFERLGKRNLTVHTYPNSTHNLNYEQWLYGGGMPKELLDIFSVCEKL